MSQTSVLRRQGSKAGFAQTATRRFKAYTQRDLDRLPQLQKLGAEQRFEMKVVSSVLPFRVNDYVVRDLIDWTRVPDDPVYQLTFPQRGMLAPEHYDRLAAAYHRDAEPAAIKAMAGEIRQALNPHPAGQMAMNIPLDPDGDHIDGLQHKYRETVLFFPSQGQTCHSYCTFCFRWPQFVGDRSLRIASSEADRLHAYLRRHREVSDLLVTGGDPMVMKTRHLEDYLRPLLEPAYDHIQTIRIGTKALTFWPYRFTSDADADGLLRLLEQLAQAGKHVAIMAHYNHWRELDPQVARLAITRLRAAGAQIRSQAPLLAHINDDANVWARMWKTQVGLGIAPYYMFVERDTGARHHFEVPLARAWEIYREAIQKVSGLGRTARGPSMSADPGKVEVQGVTEIQGERVFVLRFIQARNPDWVQRPFFARFDESATWLDQLRPAFGEQGFFFEDEFRKMQLDRGVPGS